MVVRKVSKKKTSKKIQKKKPDTEKVNYTTFMKVCKRKTNNKLGNLTDEEEHRRVDAIIQTYKKNMNRRKLKFLEVFVATYNIGKAADAAGVSRGTPFEWKKKDPKFAEAWDSAHEKNIDDLEASMQYRATHGYKSGNKHIYPETTGIFMLKHNRKEKYLDEKEIREREIDEVAMGIKRALQSMQGSVPDGDMDE